MVQAICQGCQQALPGLDAKADVPAIQLMGFKTKWREIRELYNDFYQLKRVPDPPQCGQQWAGELAWEIMTSLKEHLQWMQGPTMPGGGPERGPTRTYMPNHPAKAPRRTQKKDDNSCDHALTKAREAHWQVLPAAHLLEEKIERISQLATRMWPTNYHCSYSHSHSRMWSQGCHRRHANTPAGRDHSKVPRGTWAQSDWEDMSPSWTRSQHWKKTLQRSSIWGRHPEKVRPLNVTWAPAYSAVRAGVLLGRADSYMRLRTGVWLATRALHRELWGVGGVVRLPGWHTRLVGGVGGHPWCRWCVEACPEVWASLEIPCMRCQVLWVDNDFSAPLPQNVSKGRHSCQFQTLSCLAKTTGRDNHRRPKLMPRPFSIGLKANLPGPGERHLLVRCVQELRQAMRPLTTFSDHTVLEGAMPNLGSPEEEAAQPNTTPKEQTPRPPTPLTAALSNKLAVPAVVGEYPG